MRGALASMATKSAVAAAPQGTKWRVWLSPSGMTQRDVPVAHSRWWRGWQAVTATPTGQFTWNQLFWLPTSPLPHRMGAKEDPRRKNAQHRSEYHHHD